MFDAGVIKQDADGSFADVLDANESENIRSERA